MSYEHLLSDCRHCQGPAELIEPGDKVAQGAPAEAPAYFAYQAICAKCGMRSEPTVSGARGRHQAIVSWNQIQKAIGLGLSTLAAESAPPAAAAPTASTPSRQAFEHGAPRRARNAPLRG